MLSTIMNRFRVSKAVTLLSKAGALMRVPTVACSRFSISHGSFPRKEGVVLKIKNFASHFFSTLDDDEHSKEKEVSKETSEKLMMLFTCKICSTRVGKTFSKIAYTKGIVIIQCPSCKTRHLIADNLGWFKHLEGKNLENHLKLKNERVLSGDIELSEQDLEILERELHVEKKDDQSGSKPLS